MTNINIKQVSIDKDSRETINRNIVLNHENIEDATNWHIQFWISKQYKNITYLCRKYTPEEQYELFPNLYYWMQTMCIDFLNHGIPIGKLRKKYRYLYRGINSEYLEHEPFVHNTVISTTTQPEIAKQFITGNHHPRMFIIDLYILHPAILTIPITKKRAVFSQEKEVLLPPGRIIPTDKYIDNFQIVHFEPNFSIFSQYLYYTQSPYSLMGGYADDPRNIEGKVILFYRKIEGKEPDILSFRRIPVPIKDYGKWFFDNIRVPLHLYDNMMHIIPEVSEIEECLNDKNLTSERKYSLISKRISYGIDVLLYDPVTKLAIEYPVGSKEPVDVEKAIQRFLQQHQMMSL